ncbi:cobalamin biosynthesis protein CobQ [Rhodovulum sp. DZ06]|uniref:cobalamin biosynthesis protein CobQ n=1 Tax=Rhodovulum sp. DZ06 TaxID=3425126 RepID=UPI003D32B3CF
MNTPAHILIAAGLFARPGRPGLGLAAMAGALVPDISVFTMVAWEHLVQGRPLSLVFGYDYRDPFWQGIFAVDNSIPLWALLALAALAWRKPMLAAFAAAGLLHVICDLPLHNEDARRHFWPLSDYVFHSPLSYWNPARHAGWVAPAELLLCLAAALALARRYPASGARVALGLGLGVEALCTMGPIAAMAMAG